MEEFLTIEALIILLVLVATLVAIAVRRVRLPYTVALVLVGLVITIRRPLDIEVTPELVLSLFVPPLIFEAAFHLDLRLLRDTLPSILLLAVPGQRDATSQPWDIEDLAEIVRDTMDLAKVRTVDLDAMCDISDESSEEQGVGLVLPALMLSTDWARERAFEIIEDWWNQAILQLEWVCAGFEEEDLVGEDLVVIGESDAEIRIHQPDESGTFSMIQVHVLNAPQPRALDPAPEPRSDAAPTIFLLYLIEDLTEGPLRIDLLEDSLAVRLQATWIHPDLWADYGAQKALTGEEIAEWGVLNIQAFDSSGTSVVVQTTYEYLEKIVANHTGPFGDWVYPLYEIRTSSPKGEAIRALRLEHTTFARRFLLGQVCYGQ